MELCWKAGEITNLVYLEPLIDAFWVVEMLAWKNDKRLTVVEIKAADHTSGDDLVS